jgi:acyl-CoA synthetase (NDP forming)
VSLTTDESASSATPGTAEPVPVDGRHRLTSMLAPRGIAIVGASDNSGWSRYTYANLMQGGYPHAVHLVNRRGEPVHGQPTVASLRDIGEPVDLAYVLTGPASLPSVMADGAAAGVRNLVVIAAGFGEMGEAGHERERQLAELARGYDQLILGPNNLGFINTPDATMPWSQAMPWPMQPGGVGIMSQSGALGIFLLNYLQNRDVGISHLVTVGNEAMVTVAEGIDYLVEQEGTRVIALYLESVRHPAVFLAAAERAMKAGKPIVAYKAGRGALGAKVTAAHTGSLAGDDRVFDAVFRQHGIIRVDSIEDLVTTCGLLDAYGELPGTRVAFVTGSGAMCGVIGDSAEANGLELPEFAESTVEELRAVGLPEFATAQNPLDTTGYVVIDTNLLPNSEAVVSRDPNIDMLVVNGSVPATQEAATFMSRYFTRRIELSKVSPVPVISMEFLPSDQTPFSRQFRRSEGASYVVDSLTRGIPALAKAIWWSGLRRATRETAAAGPAGPIITGVHGARGEWSERQVGDLLAANGVPVIPQRLVTSASEAASAAGQTGFPVALKVSSPGLAHKTEMGGVVLGVGSAEAAARAYEQIVTAVAAAAPGTPIEGVLVSPMRADGVDLLVGIVRDDTWGLTLVVGLGGIWVEVLADSAVRALPVTTGEVREMLAELKSFPLLTGARGAEPVDLDELSRVVARIGAIAVALGDDVEELEINPLRAAGSGIEVLDALVRWHSAATGRATDGATDRATDGAAEAEEGQRA